MVSAVVIVSVCNADIVSWNYNRYGDAYATQSTDVAGVLSASYWNDSWLDGRTTDLLANTGATTTIDISWSSFNSWSIQESHPGTDDDGSYNKEVLNGYLNSGPADWNPWTTESSVTLSQIIAEGASYDIYVYFSSDVAGREGYVTDGSTTYYFNTLGPASIASGNALFIQAIDTTEDGYLVGANYAVFSGLLGASQTVTVQMRDTDEWGGIAAVQVVGVVPEPATMLLLGLGGLLLRKRR